MVKDDKKKIIFDTIRKNWYIIYSPGGNNYSD